MPGRNAAQRVKVFIDGALSVPQGTTMVEGLTRLFAYQPVDAEREHARRLEAIHLQLDLAEKQLSSRGFPEDLYRHQFYRVRQAFRPALLQQGFDHVRSSMDESVRLCFSWCAYAMDDEGESVGSAEVSDLVDQLRSLLDSPEMATLPPSVRDLLTTHLAALLDAFSLAEIEGGSTLRKAAKAAAADLVAHADEIDSAAHSATPDQAGFMKRCGATLKRAMDAAAAGGKGVEGVEKMIKFATERGPQALELAGEVLKQLTQ